MMKWTRQKLAHYFGTARVVAGLEGITEEGFIQVMNNDAMRRLKRVEDIVYNEYQTDSEKIEAIRRDVLEE